MPTLASYAVFCGSSSGFVKAYEEIAYRTGAAIAGLNARLVYGGAAIGLMGAVANGSLAAGGKVIGVIPGFLQTKEIVHPGLTELIVVATMHDRKLVMHEMSDAIVALPGGWGTMEELTEMLTWAQLGLHHKPIGLLNVDGFYDGLLLLTATMVANGFLKQQHADLLVVKDDISILLEALNAYAAPETPKWLTATTT